MDRRDLLDPRDQLDRLATPDSPENQAQGDLMDHPEKVAHQEQTEPLALLVHLEML
jgi:hypothetical protein